MLYFFFFCTYCILPFVKSTGMKDTQTRYVGQARDGIGLLSKRRHVGQIDLQIYQIYRLQRDDVQIDQIDPSLPL